MTNAHPGPFEGGDSAYILTDDNVVQPPADATAAELIDRLNGNRYRAKPAAGYALGARVTPNRLVVVMPALEQLSDWETRTGKAPPQLPASGELTHARVREYFEEVNWHLTAWKLGWQYVGFMVLYVPDGVAPESYAPLQKGRLYTRQEMVDSLAPIAKHGYVWCHAGRSPTDTE